MLLIKSGCFRLLYSSPEANRFTQSQVYSESGESRTAGIPPPPHLEQAGSYVYAFSYYSGGSK